ncbi:GNAT family N-acetyltransferase [Patescibacteria group bacterium]|nr:GNAT family N-acetyltransferase [Patescibacteria group bacterium]
MNFTSANKENFDQWLAMGLALWPKHSVESLKKEFQEILENKNEKVVLCEDDNGEPIAFMNLSLRHDYVEGAFSKPVAYLEGIYVKDKYRHQGIAKEFIKIAEKWAKKNDCQELGSDALIDNLDSHKFHQKLGFSKANTIVHFIKKVN